MAETALPDSLHYVDDSQPGLRRKTLRGRFIYLDAHGRRISDPATLERIKALAIPPAYTEVWICADPLGHMQATGHAPAVCRRCYIHPALLESFACGELAQLPPARKRKGMDVEEVHLMRFLQQRFPP